MSFVGSISAAAGGGAGRFSGQTRGRIQGSPSQGVNYPSPFFDVAHTYLPVTVKQLFTWCRYYFLTSPLINATVFKMAEYPITDLIIEHEDARVRRRWEEYFHDHLRFRSFQVECGLDHFCYGTSLNSLAYPFKKFLRCPTCKFQARADKIRPRWTFTNQAFRLNCPSCGTTVEAEARDVYYKNASGITPIRWNVEHIEVSYNEITGETTHFYNIPPTVRNDIVIGKKDVVEGVPQVFIQAIRQQKGIVFSKDNLFAMKRASLAQQDRGWGIPMILPVLKDQFYLQIMKKAQEAILLEHIVPLRILFPQAGSGSSDPYCVSPDTLVETPVGIQPASEVGEGDYLRSHTGAWRRVEATKRRKIAAGEKVYEFKVASLAAFPFKVSEEHPILAVPKTNRRERMTFVDPEFIPAKDLKKGDYAAYPLKTATRPRQVLDLAEYITSRAHTEDYVYRRLNQGAAEAYEWLLTQRQPPAFEWGERKAFLTERGWAEEDYATAYSMYGEVKPVDRVPRYLPVSPGLAKLVGYYLAEGSQKGTLISFALHLREKDVADEIEYIVKGLGFRSVSHHERPEQNGRYVDVEDVLLSEFLMSLCGVGFSKKRIPDVISEAPDALVLEMLSGLFTGDGCDFQTTTNRVALKLANPSMILEARRLFLRFGLIGGVIKEDPTETSLHRTASYHLNFNGEAADVVRSLFKHLSTESCIQSRTQKSGLIRGDYVLLRINDIQEVVDVPEVIGFQMHGDKSFCVAGVATHNTTINLTEWRDQVASEIARWRYDCVSSGTLVETEQGLRRADEVEAGSSLKNHLGDYSTVDKVWRRPLREGERAYRLNIRGLSAVKSVFSEGHPLLAAKKVNNGNGHKLGQQGFIRVKDLRPGDYVGYPVMRQTEAQPPLDLTQFVETRAHTEQWVYVDHTSPEVPEAFEWLHANGGYAVDRQTLLEEKGWSVNQYKIAQVAYREGRSLRRVPRYIPFDEQLAWVVGLYLAEGNTSPKQVMIAGHERETAILENLKCFFQERFGADGFTSIRGEHGVQHYFSSLVAAEFFGNLCSGSASTKEIPEVYRRAENSIAIALLKGLIDGDGCWHEDGYSNKVGYASASIQLAEGVRSLMLSLGVPVTITFIEGTELTIVGRKTKGNGGYRVHAHGDAKAYLISLFTGGPVHYETPASAGLFRDGCFWHRIRSVEEVECEEVIGFQMLSDSPQVRLEDDTETHGTFCTWGAAQANSNYIPILPLPIGNQTIGGDGRALLLTQEIQIWSEQIMVGMGVPKEFLLGGMSYSGTNVSMRMLENAFLGYIQRQKEMANWMAMKISAYMGWPRVTVGFKPFKMADDLQRKAYLFQLNQAQKVSDTTLLHDSDIDQGDEDELMIRETDKRLESTKKQQLAMAEVQAEAQLVMMKSQAKAQQIQQQAMMAPNAPGEPGGPEAPVDGSSGAAGVPQEAQSQLQQGQQQGAGMDIQQLAQMLAENYVKLPPDQQQMAMQNLEQQSPELAQMVQQFVKQLQSQGEGPQAMGGAVGRAVQGVDTRPQPEVKPPRREAALV